MRHSDAIAMLDGFRPKNGPQQWVDLGSGDGTFTRALAHLLPAESSILAVDKQPQNLEASASSVSVRFQQSDFERLALPPGLDGILMANSLHYVSDQHRFIARLAENLNGGGSIVLVEYDLNKGNPWVPYPISYDRLTQEFGNLGFSTIRKLGQRPSMYGRGNLYAAELSKELRKA